MNSSEITSKEFNQSRVTYEPPPKQEKSSLFGRVNWDKMLLFCNSALILSGVAYAFFINLPAVGFALLGYAIFEMALYSRAVNQRPSFEQVDSLQARIDELEKDIQARDPQRESERLAHLRSELQEVRRKKKLCESEAKVLDDATTEQCLRKIWKVAKKDPILRNCVQTLRKALL